MTKNHSTIFKIWRIIYPILIHFLSSLVVTFAVGFVIAFSLIAQNENVNPNEMIDIDTYMNTFMSLSIVITALANLLSLPFIVLFFKRDKRFSNELPLEKNSHFLSFLIIIPFAISLSFLLNILLSLSGLSKLFPAYEKMSEFIFLGNIWVQFACIGIIVPIVEEFVFRGLIYKRLRTYTSYISSMLISSLIFGIYHGNVYQGIFAFLIGCALSFVYEKFQNVWAPILFHIAVNSFSVFLTQSTFLNSILNTVIGILAITLITILISVITFLYIQKKVIVKRISPPSTDDFPDKKNDEFNVFYNKD